MTMETELFLGRVGRREEEVKQNCFTKFWIYQLS